eukprot:11217334-Lingulodinium_polyedra.AAC.1
MVIPLRSNTLRPKPPGVNVTSAPCLPMAPATLEPKSTSPLCHCRDRKPLSRAAITGGTDGDIFNITHFNQSL